MKRIDLRKSFASDSGTSSVSEHKKLPLPQSWSVLPIREVCTQITSGGTPSRKISDYFGGDIPWVKTKELKDCWIDETDEHLTDLGIANSSAKVLPENTLLMAMYGATVGQLGILRSQMTCNQAACALILDPSTADFRYVYYRLLQDRPAFRSLANGAAQQNLSARTIADFQILLPPIAEQRAIAGVLGALDDKIESNIRLTQLADQSFMAEMSMLLSTESSKEFAPLAKVGSIALGGTPSKARSEFWDSGDIPWINSGSLHEKPVITPANHITSLGLQKSATKLIPAGATLFAITGATLGVISRLSLAMTINQSIIAIWSDVSTAWNDYIYFALRTGRDQILNSATGAAQQHVNKSNFEDFELLVPSDRSISKMAELRPLLELQDSASLEARRLSQIRDSLLPELLSGRIRVRDAESIVEDAL